MKVNISLFFQSPINIWIFRHVSPRVSYRYLLAVGVLYYLLNSKERRHIERNIRDLMAGQEETRVKRVVRDTFKGIFTHYFEKMFSAFLDFGVTRRYVERKFDIEGAGLLTKALEKGKGCILVTAHWGAVEFIPWMLHVAGFPASVILECKTGKLARSLLEKTGFGGGTGIELISSCFGGSVLLRALQSLKANRVLMTQCDEVETWHKRRGHTVQAFGREVWLDNTIEVIARRTGAAVVAAFMERTEGGRYVLHIEDVSVERPETETARCCLQLWQKYVSLHPEQWYQWKKWDAMKAA
jgi:lauroyl/myristoyl acyltransferase